MEAGFCRAHQDPFCTYGEPVKIFLGAQGWQGGLGLQAVPLHHEVGGLERPRRQHRIGLLPPDTVSNILLEPFSSPQLSTISPQAPGQALWGERGYCCSDV